MEKLRVAQSYETTYKKEKDEIWAMFEEEKVNISTKKG
jgi:hypothetical protein